MKIGIESNAYVRSENLSLEEFRKGLERQRSHGYEGLDFGYLAHTENRFFTGTVHEREELLKAHRRIVEDCGLFVHQTHGPWRYPPQDYTVEDRTERFEKMAWALRATALLGCRNCVVHPIMPFGDKEADFEAAWNINLDYYGRLLEIARENQVVICLENMPFSEQTTSTPTAILRLVRLLNSPWCKVCLDTGHALVLNEQPGNAVRKIGQDWLQTLHVHDNNGYGDFHCMPYTGIGKWEDFSDALQEIGFDGVLSLETTAPVNMPLEFRENQERLLAAIALKLAKRPCAERLKAQGERAS